MYLTEKYISIWGEKNGALMITRTKNNFEDYNFESNEDIFVILKGYNSIINNFFENIINRIKKKCVLIIIESDIINITKKQLSNDKIIHCYCWNKPFDNDKITAIPIGLNFDRHYRPLIEWENKNKSYNPIDKKLLCFNCNLDTNQERSILKGIIDNKLGNLCDKLEFIEPKETVFNKSFIEGKIRVDITNNICYDHWRKYKFILSPRGAGEDCHRTWEAIIVGCIPIVLKSSISELYNDLPVLEINDWNDITEEFLEYEYDRITADLRENKFNLKKITLEYWTDVFNRKINFNKNIHLITYGDLKFEKARLRLVKQAHDFGTFKTIKGYSPENLTPSFVNKYRDILGMPRGGGYWIWKLDIIKQTMSQINENDFIVYLDSGCNLNKKGLKRFHEYINLFNNNDYGILSFQMTHLAEKKWTTQQIFNYFDIDENNSIKETGQYHNTVTIMRKNNHLRKYIEEFEKCLEFDKWLITDKYNRMNKNPYFNDNRHDQSISSIIRKKIGSIVIEGDESWFPPFGQGKSLDYPFWATRSRS
jgi:hypothetical protein